MWKPIRRLHIERQGKMTTGLPGKYRFIVDGIDLGFVQRVTRLVEDSEGVHGSYIWYGGDVICETREDAENKLIERALRSGHLK